MDVKNYLNDWTNWSNKNFESVRNNSNYETLIESWIEQRRYFDVAIEALTLDSTGKYLDFHSNIINALKELIPLPPSLDGYISVPIGSVISTPRFQLSIDIHGSIGYLYDMVTKKKWANSGSENYLGRVRYDTFDQKDYQKFLGEYLCCFPPECYFSPLDFGKPGIEVASPNHTTTFPKAKG